MPTKSVGNGKDIVHKGFHFAYCDLCQKDTWHYRSADRKDNGANCSNHSTFNGRKHAIVEGNTIVVAQLTKPHDEAPTERELQIINRLDRSLWRNAERSKAVISVTDCEWAKDLFPVDNTPPLDPNKTYCTFCNSAIDFLHTTTERKPRITVKMDSYRDESTGNMVMQEKVVSQVETINACPNCCLKVRKPIVVRRV